jgi:23S rRNA pseudouridine1911/1915/1917 synthase
LTEEYDDLDLWLDELGEADSDSEPASLDDEDDFFQIGETISTRQVKSEPEQYDYDVPSGEAGERVDKVVAGQRPDLSRAHIQRLVEEKRLLVNGKPGKSSLKLRGGEHLTLYIPAPQPLAHLEAENIPLDIVYEDDAVVVINKPAGLVVHPAPGHTSGTLVNALLYHVPNLNINGNQRPGIVHRLDKDTSGLLVAAKTDAALGNLIEQMKNRETLKEYRTLVEGTVQPPAGIVDAPIGRDPAKRKQMAVTRNGKPARTHFQVSEQLNQHAYVTARLETGRTHQIRVHMAYIKHPVVGDPVYGFRKPSLPLKRQFLHAYKLGFKLPSTGEYREFEAALPNDLQVILDKARNLE